MELTSTKSNELIICKVHIAYRVNNIVFNKLYDYCKIEMLINVEVQNDVFRYYIHSKTNTWVVGYSVEEARDAGNGK
jgi:hypothetical protein